MSSKSARAKQLAKTKAGGRWYRKAGGTTGRLRQAPTPATPLLSIGLRPNPGPSHGITEPPTTGIGGQLQAVRSTTGIPINNTADPSTSRYGLAVSGNAISIEGGSNSYNQTHQDPFTTPVRGGGATPSTQPTWWNRVTGIFGNVPPRRDTGDYGIFSPPITNNTVPRTTTSFRAEPTFEEALADRVDLTPYTQPRHQQLQAERNPQRRTLLDEQAERGLYQHDITMQSRLNRLDQNLAPGLPHGDVAMSSGRQRLEFSPTPSPAIQSASGMDPMGTANARAAINTIGPDGQTALPQMVDRTQPSVLTSGYSSTATHPMYGPVATPGVDGSWTADIYGGNPMPTLATMAPAADIPVQTAGPGYPGQTAPFVGGQRGPGRMQAQQQTIRASSNRFM